MKVSKFSKGSGVFKCGSCGRNTRRTHGDHSDETCGLCYDLCGLENGVSDDPDCLERYLPEAVSLYKAITGKGGTYDFGQAPELGAAVKKQMKG